MVVHFGVTIIFLFSNLFISCHSSPSENRSPRLDELHERLSYPMKKPFVDFVQTIVNRGETAGVNLTSFCAADLEMLVNQIESGKDEAMAMLDSFTHLRSGQESGFVIDTGHQSQCEGITLNENINKYHLLRVTYSSPSVDEAEQQVPGIDESSSWTHQLIWNSVSIRYLPRLFAICLPSSCSAKQIESVLKSPYFINSTHPLSLTLMDQPTDGGTIVKVIKFLSFSALLSLIIINFIGSNYEHSENSIFSHFNTRKSLRSLTKPPSQPSTGFISMFKLFYIIASNIVHLILPVTYHSLYFLKRPIRAMVLTTEGSTEYLSAAPAIMSFNFFMSSSLAIMSWYPILSKKRIHFSQFLMVRALRSIPVVLFMTLIVIVLGSLNAQSPLMQDWLDTSSTDCLNNGWLELTFLSNFADINTRCHRVAWFASADMQLYVVSFLLMVYLCNSQDHVRLVRTMIKLISIFSIFTLIAFYIAAPLFIGMLKHGLFLLEGPVRMLTVLYNTVLYLIPYACGLWIGYYMASGYQLSRSRIIPLIAIILLLCACLLASLPVRTDSRLAFSILQVLRIITYTGAVCGVYIAFWSSQDLSNKQTTTLEYICTVASRLQYPFFLIHPIVITYFSLSFEYQFYTYPQVFYMLYPAQVILSVLLAVIVHLTVESPFASLLNSFLRGDRVKTQKTV